MCTNDTYQAMVEQSRFENDKERYWRNCACLLESTIRNLNTDLFAARQELISQGLIMLSIRQKIESALACHPNAVKYLLEEAKAKIQELAK